MRPWSERDCPESPFFLIVRNSEVYMVWAQRKSEEEKQAW